MSLSLHPVPDCVNAHSQTRPPLSARRQHQTLLMTKWFVNRAATVRERLSARLVAAPWLFCHSILNNDNMGNGRGYRQDRRLGKRTNAFTNECHAIARASGAGVENVCSDDREVAANLRGSRGFTHRPFPSAERVASRRRPAPRVPRRRSSVGVPPVSDPRPSWSEFVGVCDYVTTPSSG